MNEHPTKIEIDAINKLCHPIGHIVLEWSYVDLNLDLTLKIISEDYDTLNMINNTSMSKFAGNKIKLVSLCLEKLPSLNIFKNDGLAIMKKAKDICNERNDIIHSTYAGLNNDGSFNFRKLVITKKTRRYIIDNNIYTITTLLELEKRIEGLATDIGRFGLGLRGHQGL